MNEQRQIDEYTVSAFRQLWNLYREHRNIRPEAAAEWDAITEQTRNILWNNDSADDPEFIRDFALAVLESLDRLSIGKRKSLRE